MENVTSSDVGEISELTVLRVLFRSSREGRLVTETPRLMHAESLQKSGRGRCSNFSVMDRIYAAGRVKHVDTWIGSA